MRATTRSYGSYSKAVSSRVVGFEYPAKASAVPRCAALGTSSSTVGVDPAVHSAVAVFSVCLRAIALIIIVNGCKRS